MGIIYEKVSEFKLVFWLNGIVIVGNVCLFNDGVVVVVIISDIKVKELGLILLVCIVFIGVSGLFLEIMGLGLIEVFKKVLERVGMVIIDIDLVEINEVFVV